LSVHEHISIATAALERGYIDQATFVEVVRQLNGFEAEPALEDIWIGTGRLTADQLSSLTKAPRSSRKPEAHLDTMPVGSLAAGTATATVVDNTDEGTAQTFAVMPGPDDSLDDALAEPPDQTFMMRSPSREQPSDQSAEKTSARAPSSPQTYGHGVKTNAQTHVGSVGAVSSSSGSPSSNLAPPPAASRSGRARYERREILGAGGLGTVTACFDTGLGRRVAVKVAREQEAGQILEREARIIATLEHPNIIPVYDAGHQGGVGPFYVMREVTQPSLEEVIERLRENESEAVEQYPLKRLLRYFAQICNAVDFANDRGIVHCDLKPANILMGDHGEVLVVDWGLAFGRDYPEGPRGGTPGFMAPEQFRQDKPAFDARTDVFALGSILYMLLTLEPAFPDLAKSEKFPTTAGNSPLDRYQAPEPPSELTPHREVPKEVEEVCMKALQLVPGARYATAAEVARAIDDYLEGTKELERRRAEADACAEAGDDLAERYHELDEGRPEQLVEIEELRASVPPWAPIDDKQELWNVEDMVAVTDALRVRTFQAAVSSYEQALEAVSHHERARRGLARLYWAELKRAQEARDELDQLYFEQLVKQHDDGHTLAAMSGDGRLVVASPPNVEITLRASREKGRRLVPTDVVQLRQLGEDARLLPAGSYLLEASRAGGQGAVRYPVSIRPGGERRVVVNVELLVGLASDEVVVPGGAALIGDSNPLIDAVEPREVDIGTFVMKKRPVSFQQYLEFMDYLRAERTAELDAHVPAGPRGVPLWRHDGTTWSVADMFGLDTSVALEVPVFGVTVESATAYAAWESARTNRGYRLPSDVEWEKAARGTDGRSYPWGDKFDPTFCKMRDSRRGASAPEPVGAFDTDVSPYGICDMAGGIAEWVRPASSGDASDERVYSRGGAWCDAAIDCRLTARRTYWRNERSTRVGFRLARSI
jgi:serine/threonine-protein kinase